MSLHTQLVIGTCSACGASVSLNSLRNHDGKGTQMNKAYEAERDAAAEEYVDGTWLNSVSHIPFKVGADWSRERLLRELGEVKEALEAIRKNIYSTPQLTAKRALAILKRLGVK